MNDHRLNLAAMALTFAGAVFSLANILLILQISSVTVGLAIGVITLWRMRKKS